VLGTLQFANAVIATDAATVILDGPGSAITDLAGNDALARLTTVAASGNLSLLDGRNLTTTGSLTNFGHVLIDPTSQLTVGGDYTQDAAATLEVQLGGPPPAGPAGVLTVSGTANLDGTLVLTPTNGYVPTAGDSFQILVYSARNNDFANDPPAGFNLSFDDVNGILTVIAQ
jgi:hypothetical protein